MFLINEEEEDGNAVDRGLDSETGKKCRKNWGVLDDSHLINAWLNTSKVEWSKISAVLNEKNLFNGIPLNALSCKNRWGRISRCVAKFVNAMAQAREGAAPDMSEADVMLKANQLYSDDVKADFHFSHAYEQLHNEPKFLKVYVTDKKKNQKKLDVCEVVLPSIDGDGLSFSEAEGSSKRSRLNEAGDYHDDHCSLDPSTPQVLIGDSNRKVEPNQPMMQTVGSLEEQIRSSLQVFRETNQKVDVWKEVKMKEMELKEKKMEQKNRASRYKLFNTLLGKATLTDFEEALKNKLYAELFPE